MPIAPAIQAPHSGKDAVLEAAFLLPRVFWTIVGGEPFVMDGDVEDIVVQSV